ncbi:MAG: ABC transporter permease [Oscillospiraceae bacterium]
MFFRIFKYQVKASLKNVNEIFWTLMFPIIMATLFGLAFTNILDGEKLEKVDVAVVSMSSVEKSFEEAMVSSDLFKIKETTENDAKNLLENGKISAIIDCSDGIKLTVKDEGMQQSIVKSFLDNYAQTLSTVTNIAAKNPAAIDEKFIKNISEGDFVNKVPINGNTDSTVIYYYVLIAMAVFYGGIRGLEVVNGIQANQSAVGARQSVAPTNKLKIFTATFLSAFVIQFAIILILLAYLVFIVNVKFPHIGYVILLCCVSTFMGLMFGAMISALLKKSEGLKVAILIGVTMICSFFAGLMDTSVKYVIQNAFPPAAVINPANLIADGLYSLYFYGVTERYFFNLALIFAMGLLLSVTTYLILRRQKYESI